MAFPSRATCSTNDASSAACDASRSPSSSDLPLPSVHEASVDPPALARKMEPPNADRPHSLQVHSPSQQSSTSGTVLNTKRTSGFGLVGVARARGWLRSHQPSSNGTATGSSHNSSGNNSNQSSDSVSVTVLVATDASVAAAADLACSPSTCSLSASSVLFSTGTSTTSTVSSACITSAFAATLNAALASGPMTPTTPTNPSSSPFFPSSIPALSLPSTNHCQIDCFIVTTASSTTTSTVTTVAPTHLASSGVSRQSNLLPGMSPGHGLLSALLVGSAGSTSTTPPSLRQTTQVVSSSSSSSSTTSASVQSITSTAASSSSTSTCYSYNSSLHQRMAEPQGYSAYPITFFL